MMLAISVENIARDVVSISIDGDPWRRISTTIFGRRVAFANARSLEEWEERFSQLEHSKAKDYALRLLARKSYLSTELAQKLRDKLVSEATTNVVIQELSHYFNDDDGVRRYVEAQQHRGRGPGAIKQNLIRKGVSEDSLDEYIDGADVGSQIEQLLQTKYRQRDLTNFKERQKVVGSLCRRGFSLDSIFTALSKKGSTDE
ncbi:MAG: regulatory protein RecX [Chlamydiales bacterium]|nr:regulatory protein RecX [Chlamydiales bacterium]